MGVAHSNDFPEIFYENVVVFLKLGENRIVYEVILDIEKRVTTHEFKHMAREVIKNIQYLITFLGWNFQIRSRTDLT